jgi:hypothetical protein
MGSGSGVGKSWEVGSGVGSGEGSGVGANYLLGVTSGVDILFVRQFRSRFYTVNIVQVFK